MSTTNTNKEERCPRCLSASRKFSYDMSCSDCPSISQEVQNINYLKAENTCCAKCGQYGMHNVEHQCGWQEECECFCSGDFGSAHCECKCHPVAPHPSGREGIIIEYAERIVIDYANYSGREDAHRAEFRQATIINLTNFLHSQLQEIQQIILKNVISIQDYGQYIKVDAFHEIFKTDDIINKMKKQ